MSGCEAKSHSPPFINADSHLRLCAEQGLGSIEESGCALDGEMPLRRRAFAPAGATEPAFIEKLQKARRSMCRLALDYFEHRDRFARDYCGQVVTLLPDSRVLPHGPAGPDLLERISSDVTATGLPFWETAFRSFVKLVESEEAELSGPYSDS